MIDLHTHILPGIDDGAKNTKQSIEMLGELCAQSVDEVVMTPHFYPDEIPMERFLTKRGQSYDALVAALLKAVGTPCERVKIHLASETHYSHILLNYDSLRPLCIGNTSFLLLELPYVRAFEKKMFTSIDRIINEQGITPIIAHVDRYIPAQKSLSVIQSLRELGCMIQLNCDCVTNVFSRSYAKKLVRKNLIDVLGTDCHNMLSRPPKMEGALAILKKSFGKDYALTLQRNAERVLAGQTALFDLSY